MARSCWEVQKATIKALFFREIRTRFGKYRLGYLWALLEPAAQIGIMLLIFGYAKDRSLPDASFLVFLVNGVIPFHFFSHITSRSTKAVDANQALFNYRSVKPIDTIFARTLLEIVISAAVYIFLMIILAMIGEKIVINDFVTLISAWGLLVLFSCGVGMVFMVLSFLYPEGSKMIPVLFHSLYFLSCIIFPLSGVPKIYQSYLLWNPLVHMVELCRKSVMNGYISNDVNLSYLAACTLGILFLGLTLYRMQERAMLTS